MRCVLSAMMLLATLHCRFAAAVDGPLEVTVPQGWKLEYKGEKGVDFYSVMPPNAEMGLLMFFRWPAPTNPGEMPALVRKMADGFVRASARVGKFTLISKEYDLETFAGGHCTGNYAMFRMKNGNDDFVQGIFMVSVDGQIWNGQFTGKPEDWLEALKSLRMLKKKN